MGWHWACPALEEAVNIIRESYKRPKLFALTEPGYIYPQGSFPKPMRWSKDPGAILDAQHELLEAAQAVWVLLDSRQWPR